VITNQSGIARVHFDWGAFDAATERLQELLCPSAPLAAIYTNGHGPDAPPHSWRKPSPAMLQAASSDLGIDLHRSLLVGDRLSDLQAAARTRLRWLAHACTGHGERARSGVLEWQVQIQAMVVETGPVDVSLLGSLQDFPLERINPIS
jgi:D-glycero-D-manno-heptose 1,7-bisphosphate phosphatase